MQDTLRQNPVHNFLAHLPARLQQPLPGWRAQLRMAPANRVGQTPDFTHKPGIRYNSVLLALLPNAQGELSVLLTLRSEGLKTHKGQISFPGGGIEGGESHAQAALREAHEEVGLPPADVQLLGSLTELYVPPSNSLIFPQVGYVPYTPAFTLQAAEVAEAFLVPLVQFVDPAYRATEDRTLHDGQTYAIPQWRIHPTTPLWGATAIVMSEFVALYEEYLGVPAYERPAV